MTARNRALNRADRPRIILPTGSAVEWLQDVVSVASIFAAIATLLIFAGVLQ